MGLSIGDWEAGQVFRYTLGTVRRSLGGKEGGSRESGSAVGRAVGDREARRISWRVPGITAKIESARGTVIGGQCV